jgi:RHS repeat-associated protein
MVREAHHKLLRQTRRKLTHQANHPLAPIIEGGVGPYYNWNRWYNPAIGSFLEADPSRLVPLAPDNSCAVRSNHAVWRYPYANNDPVRYTDPTGRQELYCKCRKMPGWSCVEDHLFARIVNGVVVECDCTCFCRNDADDKWTMIVGGNCMEKPPLISCRE